jgi:thioredoxin-like negative regulator of GroEL
MLGIKGVPTLKFYEDGSTVDTIVGCKDYNTIKQTYIDKIEELING